MKTNQVVCTPRDLLDAVEKRFGKLTIDLAANSDNYKAPQWFGPGSAIGEDALAIDWYQYLRPGALGWLNNPFTNTSEWVRRCYDTVQGEARGYRIIQQIPAAVCTQYTTEFINGTAYRIELNPRPYAKEVRDVMLVIWTPEKLTGIEAWRWK